MTANEYIIKTYAAELRHARAQYQDCRRKKLPIMAEHFRKKMVRCYIMLRGVRA